MPRKRRITLTAADAGLSVDDIAKVREQADAVKNWKRPQPANDDAQPEAADEQTPDRGRYRRGSIEDLTERRAGLEASGLYDEADQLGRVISEQRARERTKAEARERLKAKAGAGFAKDRLAGIILRSDGELTDWHYEIAEALRLKMQARLGSKIPAAPEATQIGGRGVLDRWGKGRRTHVQRGDKTVKADPPPTFDPKPVKPVRRAGSTATEVFGAVLIKRECEALLSDFGAGVISAGCLPWCIGAALRIVLNNETLTAVCDSGPAGKRVIKQDDVKKALASGLCAVAGRLGMSAL